MPLLVLSSSDVWKMNCAFFFYKTPKFFKDTDNFSREIGGYPDLTTIS